ncbi:MAG TPA: hypothetical protein VJV23_01920, partial [Candidatus Polarisedimenticolia bacterium]|nr:hypothetical protein [Candidatus Polarisedimenticolia bacterium]
MAALPEQDEGAGQVMAGGAHDAGEAAEWAPEPSGPPRAGGRGGSAPWRDDLTEPYEALGDQGTAPAESPGRAGPAAEAGGGEAAEATAGDGHAPAISIDGKPERGRRKRGSRGRRPR